MTYSREGSEATRASHRIKGACRMVGALSLAEVCERMERAGRANDWNAMAVERGAFESELGRLSAWLAGQRGEQ